MRISKAEIALSVQKSRHDVAKDVPNQGQNRRIKRIITKNNECYRCGREGHKRINIGKTNMPIVGDVVQKDIECSIRETGLKYQWFRLMKKMAMRNNVIWSS